MTRDITTTTTAAATTMKEACLEHWVTDFFFFTIKGQDTSNFSISCLTNFLLTIYLGTTDMMWDIVVLFVSYYY